MGNEKVESLTFDGQVQETALTVPTDFNWDAVKRASKGVNIAPKYIEFTNVGESIRGFYIGKSHVEKVEGNTVKKIPVVLIATENGVMMNGGMSLVDTITKFCRVGEAIEITYTGQKKTGSGGYLKTYSVTPLIF